MTVESKTYEILVRDLILDEIGSYFAEKEIFHDKKYKGKSGHEHQIDVSAEIKIGKIDLLFIIECKYYSKKIGIQQVLEFSSRITDISANKGILVSTIGFQKGAITYAKANRIALVRVYDGGYVPCTGGGDFNPLLKLTEKFKKYFSWFNDPESIDKIDFDLIPYIALLEKEYQFKTDFCSLYSKNKPIYSDLRPKKKSKDNLIPKDLEFCGFCYSFVSENDELIVNNSGLINYSIIEYLIKNKNMK